MTEVNPSTTPPPPATPPDTVDEAVFTAFAAEEKKLIWASRILALALVVIILGFFYGYYATFRGMYQPENFDEPVKSAIEDLGPQMGESLVKALEDVRPTYLAMAEERWSTAGPALKSHLNTEFKAFATSVQTQMSSDFDTMLREVIAEREERILAQLPQYRDPAAKERFRSLLQEQFLATSEKTAEAAYAANEEQVQGLLMTLEDIRENNPYANMTVPELNREFFHHLLMWVDYHIMNEEMQGVLP